MTLWAEMEPLLERLEQLGDPSVREQARELVARLMRLHEEALGRLVDLTTTAGFGDLLNVWKNDPEVSGLLLLHGLHPEDVTSRVRQALSGLLPIATFFGVEIELRAIREDAVTVYLKSEANLPPDVRADLIARIEAAIVNLAPEIRVVHFEGQPRRVSLPLLQAGKEGKPC